MTGAFIVFEGGDGVGKSTQVGLLVEWLASHAIAHLVTRQPGGSPLGSQLRHLVLDPATGDVVPGGIEAQARRAFDNLKAVADAAGGTDHQRRAAGKSLGHKNLSRSRVLKTSRTTAANTRPPRIIWV